MFLSYILKGILVLLTKINLCIIGIGISHKVIKGDDYGQQDNS